MAEICAGAGEAGAHPGAGVRGIAVQGFAHGGNGEVRARDLFFQRRRGKTVWRGGENSRPVAESGDLRFEAGNVRGWNHRHGSESDREGRVRRHHHELRECGHGGAFGKIESGHESGGGGGRWARANLSGDEAELGEERILVPSPKVATYDLRPEMSAAGITDTVVKAIEKGEFDAIIMNYANADMVGQSGKLKAAMKAVEAVDAGLARIYQAMKPRGGAWIITADHGNAETMIDPATGGPHTYHTTNPVPLILVSEDGKLRLKSGGSLRDIAPTMLGLLGQPRPADMTGNDLRIVS